MSKKITYPTIVYLECVLMAQGELIHYGKSLGFITKEQKDLVENKATKLTRGSQPVVAVQPEIA